MRQRWTEEEIWAWYKARPWISGFNFIPSGAMEGVIWMLQEYDHENAFREAAKEIALAAAHGFNSVRVFLPFYLWRVQHDSYMKNLEQFLALLDSYHMTMMPVLFGDCCVPKSKYKDPVLGPQPEPEPGYFGGSSVTPFDDDTQLGDMVGYDIIDEPGMEPTVEAYVREMAQVYGQDDRIIIWNVWNEIGNSQRDDKSLPMMRKVFGWLRDEDVKQPLTSDVWGAGADHPYGWLKDPHIYADVEKEAIELSDIITFHFYGDYTHARMYIKVLKEYGRPLINTEWMHRPYRSIIQTHLPLWKKEKIGSYFFGFVNGKAQFNFVWEFIKKLPDIDTRLWMHDIFHSDFTPYDEEEIEVIRECNKDKKIF
ncbi:MAG: hypothetical protein II759_00670 [Lachnospiraceae bacterium]|nr:hypothetical protein [Lachnospiraceae bacterium]